jgi:hypothetical protein
MSGVRGVASSLLLFFGFSVLSRSVSLPVLIFWHVSQANPFDSADDVNPFGKVEEYNPFAGPGAQGAPTSPSPPPRSTSPAPASLQFQGSHRFVFLIPIFVSFAAFLTHSHFFALPDPRYDDFVTPVSGQVGQPAVSNKIPTAPADLQDIKIDDGTSRKPPPTLKIVSTFAERHHGV